jgi:hypothetical protein
MAARDRTGGGVGGVSLGGILVIVGIVLMIVWSFWIGLIILVDRLRRLRPREMVLTRRRLRLAPLEKPAVKEAA